MADLMEVLPEFGALAILREKLHTAKARLQAAEAEWDRANKECIAARGAKDAAQAKVVAELQNLGLGA